MNKPENRQLERVQYWQGQMLRSNDFLDIQRVEAQRRWWHNRALHSAYGVYQGMQASEIDNSGNPFISVTPGIAYDCFGRELVLQCSASISIPPLSSPGDQVLTLLARYRGTDPRKETDHRSAVCCLATETDCAQTVEFVWTKNPLTSPAEGVPLGQFFKGQKFSRFRPSIAQRPLARPKLGSGSTVPGATSWQPWDYTTLDGNFAPLPIEIGVQTTIDTSAAGFTEVPQYFAWLEGSIWNPQSAQLIPALLPSLADESINSFTFRLLLLPPPPPTGSSSILARRAAASAAPSVATQPANQTVTAGQTATFTVAATGTAPLSYQWQKNGANIAGATSASYTTPDTTTSDSGSTFAVVVTNTGGSATSNAATLTVNAGAAAPQISLVQNANSFSVFAQQQEIYVAWVGCQMPLSSPFGSRSAFFFSKVLQPEVFQRKAR